MEDWVKEKKDEGDSVREIMTIDVAFTFCRFYLSGRKVNGMEFHRWTCEKKQKKKTE